MNFKAEICLTIIDEVDGEIKIVRSWHRVVSLCKLVFSARRGLDEPKMAARQDLQQIDARAPCHRQRVCFVSGLLFVDSFFIFVLP